MLVLNIESKKKKYKNVLLTKLQSVRLLSNFLYKAMQVCVKT